MKKVYIMAAALAALAALAGCEDADGARVGCPDRASFCPSGTVCTPDSRACAVSVSVCADRVHWCTGGLVCAPDGQSCVQSEEDKRRQQEEANRSLWLIIFASQ